MRKRAFVWVVLSVCGAGCGSVSENHPTPSLLPGGGVGGGHINGYVNAYVVDQDTRNPVTSATVRIGASADAMPCTATTDSTGLATFDPQSCKPLVGPIDVTASADGYAPSTWLGVDGANLSIQIQAKNPAAVPIAAVSGTIAGWDSLPAPAAGHTTIGFVAASQTTDLGDAANNIAQGTRDVSIGGSALTTTVPSNTCVRNALVDDCNWQLAARTGAQAHFAIIVDDDDNGTPNDNSDDVMTLVGWALMTGLNLGQAQMVTGETLAMVAAADLQAFNVAFPPLPSGMAYLSAYPAIELPGGQGRIPAIFPALGTTATMTKVPKLGAATTAGLAGGSYDLIAAAQATKTTNEPATLAWLHGVDPTNTVTISSWLPPPTGITAAAGTYSFAPVAGATVHSAELKDPAAGRTWSVTIFDGSTSFTLPGLTPNPLITPSATDTLTVSALVLPGVDLTDVSFDDVSQKLTALSSSMITFAY